MSVKRYYWDRKSDCDCEIVEQPDGAMVDYDEHASVVAALEARCAALAAELNEIKVAVIARMKLHEEIRNAVRPPHTDFWHQSIYMADKRVDDSLASTPNHDAFLAEVRAQGVDTAIGTAKNVVAQEFQYKDFETAQRVCSKFPESDLVGKVEMVEWLEDFAAQIRQEAAQ